MSKGIVMELKGNSIIVMTEEGRFERISKKGRNCQVGQEIRYKSTRGFGRSQILVLTSGLTAAAIICFVFIGGLLNMGSQVKVAAYVTMDVNPSVELALDDEEIVREIRGLNQDGAQMAKALHVEGKPLTQAASVILDWLDQGPLAKGEGDIIISSTVVGNQRKVSDVLLADKMEKQVTDHLIANHADLSKYAVAAFAAPPELRQEAGTHQLSTGKYAIYLNAKSMGTEISLDQLREMSIYTLAKQMGGMGKLYNRTQPINKDNLTNWLAMEKEGSWNKDNVALPNEGEKNQPDSTGTPVPTPTPTPANNSAGNESNTAGKASGTKSTPMPTPTPKKENTYTGSGNADNAREEWLRQKVEREYKRAQEELKRKQEAQKEKEERERKAREKEREKQIEKEKKDKNQEKNDDRDDRDSWKGGHSFRIPFKEGPVYYNIG
ncbi:anti-sigma factor domain-containing protein [Paenibacillus chitinolyticus]|uniref:anti-sigma-I factor RsgI family protein n=1 Tax=Paenibacillus chitinolyticus TaxID=79263 RepID=UPI00386D5118